MMSKSLIARFYNVSDNTVQSVFDTIFYNDTVYKDFLPKVICIDEFTLKRKLMLLIYVMLKMVKL